MSQGLRIRSTKELPAKNFEKHLSIYSASAVMAGVGVLALVQPAEGEIVVTQVNIPICGATVDLNKDGNPELLLSMLCQPVRTLVLRQDDGGASHRG